MGRIKHHLYKWFDPGTEDAFLLAMAPKNLRMSYESLRSCAKYGRRSCTTGEIVRLRVCLLSAGMGTTLEEYRRFMTALNAPAEV